MDVVIRAAAVADRAAVAAVLRAAFPSAAEAELVARLEADGDAVLALVAERVRASAGGARGLVGHVLFSPVTVDGARDARGLGLAPLAVLPAEQGRGIGARLVQAGLERCRARSGFVVVLGSPAYYGRFGFRRAAERHLGNEYGAGAAFQVLELAPGAIPAAGGLVRYAPAFAALA